MQFKIKMKPFPIGTLVLPIKKILKENYKL